MIAEIGLLQYFCHADDSVHRGPDLMRHIGKKFTFSPGSFFGLFLGKLKLILVFFSESDIPGNANQADDLTLIITIWCKVGGKPDFLSVFAYLFFDVVQWKS